MTIDSIVIEEKKRRKEKKVKGLQVCRIPDMRADVQRNLKAVAKYMLQNPSAKIVDVQRETGLSYNAVKRALSHMDTYIEKDDRILGITEQDLAIVALAQDEIYNRLSDWQTIKGVKLTDLLTAMENSSKRYMLFRGDATNSEWGLKTIDNIEIL